jgi:hypothetical protein
MNELWDLWFPNAGATGLSFARCRVGADAAAGRVLVHAAPRHLEVVVRDDQGQVVAEGHKLRRGAPGPMSLLIRDGDTIRLQDHWPTQDDLGLLVLLPGGEAGILTSWWHAPDHSEWRWHLELSNYTCTRSGRARPGGRARYGAPPTAGSLGTMIHMAR